MSHQPLVTIIVPTFNRSSLLKETLDSLLLQVYSNWECVVVDDGSTDKTEELVANYRLNDNRFKYYKRPRNFLPGGNGARNFGFTISKGDYIQWFDDDDVMLEQFLEDKLKAFDSKIDFVICSSTRVDAKLNTIENIDLKIKQNLYKDYALWRFKIVTNNVLFKREFLLNKPLFNPHILRGQESEFFSRLFFEIPRENYKIINKPLFLYRQHSASKTASNSTYNSKFKKSEIFIATEHFKKSIRIDDGMLIQYFYGQLVRLCFTALRHKDVVNAKMAFMPIKIHLKSFNWWLVMQLQCVLAILLKLKKGPYKLENYYKSYKIV